MKIKLFNIGGKVKALTKFGAPLPYDYEVEWLQSDGVAYVDTGIETGGSIGVENQFDITTVVSFEDSVTDPTSSDWVTAIGPSNASSIQIGFYSANTRVYAGRSGVTYGPVVKGVEYTVRAYKGKGENVGHAEFNGEAKNTPVITSTTIWPSKTLVVFRGRYGSTDAGSRLARVSSFMVEFNEQFVDFIPVCKDGMGYFYDRISGQLFGNSAKDADGNPVGELIMGPRKS